MRIFIALDIPAGVRAGLTKYMERARLLAPEARWARVEGLHVTLKFVGEASEARVDEMKTALASVKAAPFVMHFTGVGFFPNPNAPRVFWAGVDGGDHLPHLASTIDVALEKHGFPRETKPYHPHLTLARTSARPLRELQQLLADPPPQFGTMTAREFFLYRSQPQKGGSKYTRLERFTLD
ncbi:MAG TPA: RNA 2',3'-cyclic phosphodiesterase [Candidatus Dormibacteraeota bacterium]|jgi:2'-5' RNA ligase|nr:RNA 2',3'-cyclic phosphodiesterase [Candidatus Dormibacteraeota bacterium]